MDFPRILRDLRIKYGYTQKQVAADLHVTQALMSHYEKGIRECGLDFIIQIAEYYDVTCDYLLGRTPDPFVETIPVSEIPYEGSLDPQAAQSQHERTRYVLLNSISLVYEVLNQIANDKLIASVSHSLDCAVYKAFRVLYSSAPLNPEGLFELKRGHDSPLLASSLLQLIRQVEKAADNNL